MLKGTMIGQRKQNSGVRKRSPNACMRCRQQKIKCTGTFPCQPCSTRKLPCTFDDSTQKILVTKGYIEDLRQKAEHIQSRTRDTDGHRNSQHGSQGQTSTALQDEVSTWLGEVEASIQIQHDQDHDRATIPATRGAVVPRGASSSPSVQLVNPLAIDAGNYMADPWGKAFHLGRSSNWSFGRRVLNMACERLGVQLSTDGLHFEGAVYNLQWQTLKVSSKPPTHSLPSPDHAMYLINAAKFHCGQMFHLFDEDDFMRNFAVFHESRDGMSKVSQLWYIHYLLVIAFGKAFVARNIQGGRNFDAELFLEAMRRLPEITFFCADQTEAIEILVCAALYLQCLDFRSEAYNLIGQALRKALEQGMHTQMSTQHLSDPVIQRCRKVWWTVYMLDRQMSSLMGLPLAIRDDDISALLPSFPNSSQKAIALELHVKLSRVIADILNTVYSVEGRLAQKYLTSTKQALKNIANVKDLLKQHIDLPDSQSMAGISRFTAYLHLLYHQCIVLTTRPLAYSFLEKILKHAGTSGRYSCPTGSVRVLLRTCIESAQQMLHILTSLQSQDLLDSFLPFDLESVFISTIVLIMTTTIDPSLIEDHTPWSETAYSILDEMISRGNMIAVYRKGELSKLATVLSQLPTSEQRTASGRVDRRSVQHTNDHFLPTVNPDIPPGNHGLTSIRNQEFDENFWQEELTADQLMLIADSLDVDGFDWMTASVGTSSTNFQAASN